VPDEPRILFLDIETKLIELYSFGIRDQHITHKQIKDLDASGRMVHCVGIKPLGGRARVLTEWDHGHEAMIQETHRAVCEADALATFNGVRFDWPKLMGQFLLLGLDPPRPPAQIDIFKTTRKMGFVSNKLDYIAPLLGLGHKVKHAGLEMWIDVHNGCPKAQKKMARYCAGDVRLTEEVYKRVLPFIDTHPRLGNRHGQVCAKCGSDNLTSQGWKPTVQYRVQSLKCGACGGWQQGRRQKVA